jgi:hypothetical protein
MKKELLNEVSRIKNMMKQLNEDDFTVNNEEPKKKFYWDNWKTNDDSEEGDEDKEELRRRIRDMVRSGELEDRDAYNMEYYIDSGLGKFAEYRSGGGSNMMRTQNGALDIDQTLRNLMSDVNGED